MENLRKSQSIQTDNEHRELRFSITGLWKEDEMREFLDQLAEGAAEFIRRKQPFNSLADLSEFVPQDQRTAAAIRDSLMQAQKFGLKRFAIISDSTLVRMQYRRITSGLEVEFFHSKGDALRWMREPARAGL